MGGSLISVLGVIFGVVGLVFLLLYPPLGIVLILLGLLMFLAANNAKKRREEREWREQMLKK